MADNHDPKVIVRRYLQDAIAAESSFETQLRSFAKEGDDVTVQELFRQHAGAALERMKYPIDAEPVEVVTA